MGRRRMLNARTRFEVLKRDGFRCVYCGATAETSALHVDHKIPLAEGGTDHPDNLVAACIDCNAGKSAVPLDESRLTAAQALAAAEARRTVLTLYRDGDALCLPRNSPELRKLVQSRRKVKGRYARSHPAADLYDAALDAEIPPGGAAEFVLGGVRVRVVDGKPPEGIL